MAKPTAQQCHALTSYYVKAYTSRHKVAPSVNRNTARWGFESMLMDMPADEVKELIDFYLTTASARKHPLDWFFYNYERLVEDLEERRRDREERARLRKESEERTREWKRRGMTTLSEGE